MTDANVVLGYIPADYFLGGKIPLDVGRAEKAIMNGVAKPLKLDLIEAAYSITRLAEENLGKEIFLGFVKKGFDPRDFVLVMGGGGGPVHAAAIAKALGITEVYIPKHAAVFCPVGILLADYKHILTRFYHKSGTEISAKGLAGAYAVIEAEGAEILKRQKIAKKEMRLVRGADIRYYGQLHDIEVLLPAAKPGARFTEETMAALIDGFHRQHELIYGRSNPSIPITIETLKVHAVGKRPSLQLTAEPLAGKSAAAALKRRRPVYFGECGFVETPCYDGDKLKPGNVIRGPAVIEESQTTILAPGDCTLTIDAYRNYILRR